MIKIQRPPNPPSALAKPEIQAYLDLCAAYSNGELPEPPAKPGSYRSDDLLNAFEDVFHSKCYLTENKFLNGADLEVDHFVPRNVAPERLYDWTNLYPIDPKANKMRPKSIPEGGYLDPCLDDVEELISYIIVPNMEIITFTPKDTDNLKASNTAKLLDYLHNGEGETVRSTIGLRKAIFKRHAEIAEESVKYSYPKTEKEKQVSKVILEGYFSKKSAFTMLMRNSETGQRLSEFHRD